MTSTLDADRKNCCVRIRGREEHNYKVINLLKIVKMKLLMVDEM